jgi:hypothetical protein
MSCDQKEKEELSQLHNQKLEVENAAETKRKLVAQETGHGEPCHSFPPENCEQHQRGAAACTPRVEWETRSKKFQRTVCSKSLHPR